MRISGIGEWNQTGEVKILNATIGFLSTLNTKPYAMLSDSIQYRFIIRAKIGHYLQSTWRCVRGHSNRIQGEYSIKVIKTTMILSFWTIT